MFGGPMSAAGIVYQAMRDIFEEVSRLEREAGKVVKIKCCFLEIYNEEVFDLLLTPPSDDSMNSGLNTSGISGKPSKSKVGEHPSPTSRYSSPNSSPQKTRVQLQSRGLSRKDAEKHSNTDDLHISGLSYIYPKSLEEFARRIEHGHSNRVVATTDSNTKSSRSHAIITVEIKVLDRGGRNSEDDHRGGASDVQGTVARINFCDLAGSERAAATTNSGVRLREGGSINRSLLALSAMVRGLIQKKRHPTLQKFVPYRGSKLTRLLSGSIGGNSRTLMLFCLSPCSNQYEESVNTMHFAMQVKQIQVNAKRNEYHVNSERVAKYQGALIEELYSEIGLMRMELARLKGVQSSALLKDGKFTTAKNDKREGLGRAKPAAARAFLVPSGSNDSLTMRVCSPLQLSSFLRAQSATRRASKASTADVSLRSPLPLLSVASTVASFAEPVSPLTPLLNSAFRQISSSEPTTGPFSGNATQGNREAAMNALPPAALSKSSSGPSPQCSHFLSPESTGGGGIVYTELEQRLRRSAAEKETLYHQLRDIQEQQSECDIRLRAHKWKLAQFLVNSSMNSRGKESSIEGIDVMERDADDTPVGIIGLQQLIQRTEEESAAKGKELTKLSLALEWCDNRIQETRQSLLREPTSEMLELLLDNARLRDSYTEAEGLAAQYYQESRVLQNRQSEYVHALSLAVGAIRALLPNVIHDRASAHVVEHARSVLLYALLPSANTSDMIAIFQNALHADTAELLPPLHPFSSPKASQQQEEARPHLSRRDRTGDQEGERQKLQEHYQELVEVAELFRSTFAPYERGMRRASDFIVKADPPEDASKEDSHAPSLVGGESGGEEDGAPTPALVEQITPASPPDPPNGGEGFSMSGLDDFPSAYPVKNERVAGVEATTPSPLPPLPAKPHARRAVKPPEAALARAAFSKSGNGVADRRVRAGSQSSTSRFTRAGPSAPSDDPLFSPGKGSVRAFAPTQIYTGSSPQKQKLSSSLIRNNTALETPFGSVSSLPEVKAPSLVHLFKQNGRFCRAHTIPSVAVANSMNRPNSSSSSSVMSKAQNKVRKKQTFLS
ncbi:unnamed protein product [Phytomonas sp. EM1]|nr:unnamed protein product [Phytomonas sp. EM1]|eukprot:CCW63505.1 unnamed protein product [Phytomonas sp. isolate EM1]